MSKAATISSVYTKLIMQPDKNILKTKSNQTNTLNNLFDPDVELVRKLNYFDPNDEIGHSLFSMKSNFVPPLKPVAEKFKLPSIITGNFDKNSLNSQMVEYKNNLYKRNESLKRLEHLANENTLESEKNDLMDNIENLKRDRQNIVQNILNYQDQIKECNVQIEFLQNFDKFSEALFPASNNKNLEIVKSLKRKNTNDDKTFLMAISRIKRDSNDREATINNMILYLEKYRNEKLKLSKKLNDKNKEIKLVGTKLKEIKNKLMLHYHTLLREGLDTRQEGLVWLIKAIWNLNEDVIMSYLPNYLDEKAIDYIFNAARKERNLQNTRNKIEEQRLRLREFHAKKRVKFSIFKTGIVNNFLPQEKNILDKIQFKQQHDPYANNPKDDTEFNVKKIQDLFSKNEIVHEELKRLMNNLKDIESEAENQKRQIAQDKKDEVNRIGREFLLNDYKKRYGMNMKTVISAISGEDNSNSELFRLEKEEKVFYFSPIGIQR